MKNNGMGWQGNRVGHIIGLGNKAGTLEMAGEYQKFEYRPTP